MYSILKLNVSMTIISLKKYILQKRYFFKSSYRISSLKSRYVYVTSRDIIYINVLRLHLGANTDHNPFLRHNALFGPTIAKPASHLKCMNPPTRLLPVNNPLTGGKGLIHRFFNANMGDTLSGSVSLSLFPVKIQKYWI